MFVVGKQRLYPLIGRRLRHFIPGRTDTLVAVMAVDDVVKSAGGVVVHHGEEAFTRYRNRWDSLSERSPSPFLTHGWLLAWWQAFGRGQMMTVALHGTDGALRAAATFQQAPLGGLAATANDHSGDWDAVAEDDAAREELWDAIAELDIRYVTLRHLRAGEGSQRAAQRALGRDGFRIHTVAGNRSPYVELPDTFDELLGGYSRNLRSQLGRRRRQLEREGELRFRVTTGGPSLDGDLDALFRVEASGWKAREGSAILGDPSSERLYRQFAHALAAEGRLRLYLLELGGTAVAGDLGCAIGDTGFLVKTGFDEAWGKLSPGLVLRGEVLRASIEEGLRGYDFLGPDDPYKLRWTEDVRPRVTVRGFRGAAALPGMTWHRAVRPALKRARRELAARRPRGDPPAPGPGPRSGMIPRRGRPACWASPTSCARWRSPGSAARSSPSRTHPCGARGGSALRSRGSITGRIRRASSTGCWTTLARSRSRPCSFPRPTGI